MIYTVTLNPSLDYFITLDKLNVGEINRFTDNSVIPGGKGINVSQMLHSLGEESTALGFVAGFTGKEIEDRLRDRGVRTDFIHLDSGMSRLNVKVEAEEETQFNGNGPDISKHDIAKLYMKLQILKSSDMIVLAGNIPGSLPADIYESICERVSLSGARIVCDVAGDSLFKVLKYEPFLIKPNQYELAEAFGKEMNNIHDVIDGAHKLRQAGAQNVLVSMGAEGAVLVAADESEYIMAAPKGEAVNTVGAGDSMVAGFIYGFEQTKNYEKALRYGVAAGSASAFSKDFGTKAETERLMKQ